MKITMILYHHTNTVLSLQDNHKKCQLIKQPSKLSYVGLHRPKIIKTNTVNIRIQRLTWRSNSQHLIVDAGKTTNLFI